MTPGDPVSSELLRAAVFHTPGNPFWQQRVLESFSDGGLLIENGRIAAIAPRLAAPEDAEIIDFTLQLIRKHRVDDDTFKAVQARCGNDQLLQLTGAIGYYVMLAMTVNACELEAAPGAEVLKP